MSVSKTYHKLLQERFLLVNCIQTGLLMGTGNVMSQQFVEKRGKKHEVMRTIEFASLGLCLVGPAVTVWYKVLAKQFGCEKNPYTAFKKVACDQLIFGPSFLIIFITILSLLHGNDLDQIKGKMRSGYIDILKMNYKERFFLVNCIQTGLLMGTGDVMSQQFVEKRGKKHEVRRTIEFASMGLCLVGPAVTVWYKVLAKQFGCEKNPYTAFKKVACDQLIFAPSFLIIFITTLSLLHGDDLDQIKGKFRNEYIDIMKANYTVWPAIQMINFYFVPLKYQVLMAQSVALLWNTYLSWKTENY